MKKQLSLAVSLLSAIPFSFWEMKEKFEVNVSPAYKDININADTVLYEENTGYMLFNIPKSYPENFKYPDDLRYALLAKSNVGDRWDNAEKAQMLVGMYSMILQLDRSEIKDYFDNFRKDLNKWTNKSEIYDRIDRTGGPISKGLTFDEKFNIDFCTRYPTNDKIEVNHEGDKIELKRENQKVDLRDALITYFTDKKNKEVIDLINSSKILKVCGGILDGRECSLFGLAEDNSDKKRQFLWISVIEWDKLSALFKS